MAGSPVYVRVCVHCACVYVMARRWLCEMCARITRGSLAGGPGGWHSGVSARVCDCACVCVLVGVYVVTCACEGMCGCG